MVGMYISGARSVKAVVGELWFVKGSLQTCMYIYGCIHEASLWGLSDCLYTQGYRYIDVNCLILGGKQQLAVILSACTIQIHDHLKLMKVQAIHVHTCNIPQVLSVICLPLSSYCPPVWRKHLIQKGCRLAAWKEVHTVRSRSSTHSQPNVPCAPQMCIRSYLRLLKDLKSNSSSIVLLSSFTMSFFTVYYNSLSIILLHTSRQSILYIFRW